MYHNLLLKWTGKQLHIAVCLILMAVNYQRIRPPEIIGIRPPFSQPAGIVTEIIEKSVETTARM